MLSKRPRKLIRMWKFGKDWLKTWRADPPLGRRCIYKGKVRNWSEFRGWRHWHKRSVVKHVFNGPLCNAITARWKKCIIMPQRGKNDFAQCASQILPRESLGRIWEAHWAKWFFPLWGIIMHFFQRVVMALHSEPLNTCLTTLGLCQCRQPLNSLQFLTFLL